MQKKEHIYFIYSALMHLAFIQLLDAFIQSDLQNVSSENNVFVKHGTIHAILQSNVLY